MDTPTSLGRSLELTGQLPNDVPRFFARCGHAHTAAHSAQVAAQAGRLAERFGVSMPRAKAAGWLHDVSAVIPNEKRVRVALDYGIEVLPEEEKLPMIVHQKLSARLAHDLFGVADADVLSAVGCHTTLKADASPLDKVVFVADKIAWDQEGKPPYLTELAAALDGSLDRAAFVYLDYLWTRRHTLPVLHPWVAAAHRQLQR
ncbi:MAG: hypothetical protein AVDCRST_MAG86-3936 [uncultured Truepera sp.]|uniref:HD domain-containing protein n=1 Tax=uncultured Truepera sp. TaxID=543023 RepID=A0A6J4VWL1_9DEIN|nr:MAG: hypothetical protein AVDCRST_MAG86-3936 [uncultured Truepera sp.]